MSTITEIELQRLCAESTMRNKNENVYLNYGLH